MSVNELVNGSSHAEPLSGIDTKKYALQVRDFDFGLLNARNQFISKVINPMMDEVMPTIRMQHVVDSETQYSIALVITAVRELEPLQ